MHETHRSKEQCCEQARAAVAALETQLDKMTLRAPIDGLVSSRPAQAGEAAVAGETALVLFIDELQYVEEDQLAALITASAPFSAALILAHRENRVGAEHPPYL